MFHGVWQLARRAMQSESVRIGPNLMRFTLALLLCLVILESGLDNTGTAKGLRIFQSQILLTHLFLTINAVFGFSQVITEEREAGTLDLLQLAGINSLSVILGNWLPRFWESLLLIAVQFPFTLLTITLGGVAWAQVLAAYVFLLAYSCLVAGIGLYGSASYRTSKAALVATSVIVFLYLSPFILRVVGGGVAIVVLTGELNLQIKTMEIMQSGYQDSPWCLATFLAFGAGILFAVRACYNLNRVGGSHFFAAGLEEVFRGNNKVRRAWTKPFAWLDFTLTSGGLWRMMLRSAAHFGLLFWMLWVQGAISRGFAWASLLGCLVSLLDATWSANRLFSDEIQNQTWSILVQTPNSLRRISAQKTLGWALGMSPSIVLPYLFILLTIISSPYIHGLVEVLELIIGSIVCGLAVVAYLHLMVLFSLDWHWKAIPVSLTLTCVLAFVYICMLVPWRSSAEVRCALFIFTGIMMLAICCALQFRIYSRLRTLAGVS